jgi:hypothetical protein
MWKVAQVNLDWRWLHADAREWLVCILCAAKKSECSRLPVEMWEKIFQLAVQYNFSNHGMDPVKLCTHGFGLGGFGLDLMGSWAVRRSVGKGGGWYPNNIDIYGENYVVVRAGHEILKKLDALVDVSALFEVDENRTVINKLYPAKFGSVRKEGRCLDFNIKTRGFDIHVNSVFYEDDSKQVDMLSYSQSCRYNFKINKWQANGVQQQDSNWVFRYVDPHLLYSILRCIIQVEAERKRYEVQFLLLQEIRLEKCRRRLNASGKNLDVRYLNLWGQNTRYLARRFVYYYLRIPPKDG